MKEYPMTFDEFTTRFATEEQCRDYLYRLRRANGFVCQKCTYTKAWNKGATLYECARCGRQTSVIAGTIFQGTRKPLKVWFTAIWWLTTQKSGASAMGLQRVLGLNSYTAAWTWLHKIRSAMVNPNRAKLAGAVEVDEIYVGGEEHGGKRGRGTENKSLVVIGVELLEGKNQLGRCRMQVVPDASGESLSGFIEANMERGSTIVTDGWSGYLPVCEKGFAHAVVDKSDVDDEKNLMPHVHMIASLLKRWLLGTHQGAVQEMHLQAYLNEYAFRFNRRKSANRGLLFYRLLESAMQVPPTTQDELLGHQGCELGP
jgi:transposase-like protein